MRGKMRKLLTDNRRERMSRGSITLFVSMLLLVLLGLIFAGLKSMRQAAARAATASALEQGLYSVFAQYDRELFEDYGLLFLDGGYGTSGLRLDEVLRETETYAEYILDPTKNNLTGGGNLLSIRLNRENCSVTGYVLATDQENTAFRRQVCEQMKLQAGAELLKKISEGIYQDGEKADGLKKQAGTYRTEKAQEYYDRDVAEGLCRPVPSVEQSGEESEEISAEEIAEGFGGNVVPVWENPLLSYRLLRGKGLLKLVFAENESGLSRKSIGAGELLSDREHALGMGMTPSKWERPMEKLLIQEFLMEDFPCFQDGEQQKPLLYQAEYAIGGRRNDRDNLKLVLSKMQVLRAASNMIFLMTDPDKRAQADLLAAGISAGLLNPELAPVLAFAIRVAWAYGESVLDLQVLTQGGKIPLVKTAESWQLSIENIGRFTSAAGSERKSSRAGLEYRDYLRILLMGEGTDRLTGRIMDLTELNIRTHEGKESFRLDHCIDAVNIEIGTSVGTNTYTAERNYGYDM